MQEEQHLRKLVARVSALPEGERYPAVVRLYDEICEKQDFAGEETFSVFHSDLLMLLFEYERQYLADLLVKGMKEPYRLSCEAHMWGLCRVTPTLHSIYQRGYAEAILRAADSLGIHEHGLLVLTKLIHSLKIEERADMVYYFAGMLKGNHTTKIKITVVKLVGDVTSCVPEAERVVLADCVIPLIYHSDRDLVQCALGYFDRCFSLLPAQHRFSYARMIGSLASDVSFGPDVLPLLSRMRHDLSSDMERQRIQVLIDENEVRSKKGGQETRALPLRRS